MKSIFPISILAAILFFSFTGCEDDASPIFDEAAKLTKTELITKEKWILYDLTFNDTSEWVLYPECSKDNLFVFNTDGSGSLDAGVNKCDTIEQQVTPLTWAFNQDETELTLNDEVLKIEVLTETEMTLSLYDEFLKQTQKLFFNHK